MRCFALTVTCLTNMTTLKRLLFNTYRPANLIGWWKLNDSSGNIVRDSSIYLHHGQSTGGPVQDTGQNGLNGGALIFNGTTQSVTIPKTAKWADNLSNFTVMCWYKSSTAPSSGTLIFGKVSTDVGTGTGWIIQTHGGTDATDVACFIQNNSGNSFVGFNSGTVNNGNWHHICMVVTNGNTVVLYIDGSTTGTVANNGGTFTAGISNTSNIMIAQDPSGQFFTGSIDDCRIYNVALSASDVLKVYRANAF